MRCSIEKVALALLLLFFANSAVAQGPASDLARNGYSHDRFGTQPRDYVREFRAFVVSFDTEDGGRARGVPEWVAYELRRKPPGLGFGPPRPSRWKTDAVLHQRKVAPNDADVDICSLTIIDVVLSSCTPPYASATARSRRAIRRPHSSHSAAPST